MPDGPDEVYHLVSMKWWQGWEEYCQGKTQSEPGPLNSDLTDLLYRSKTLKLTEQENLHFRDGLSEDSHYKIIDHGTWLYLHAKYGGVDLPRFSVSVPTASGEDYLVEANLRKFKIVTYPKVRYTTGIPEMTTVFVSRGAKVCEL